MIQLEEQRIVDTPSGIIQYTLQRKSVKNFNLRVGRDQEIYLSIPKRCSVELADRFVQEKSAWLTAAMARQCAAQQPVLPPPDRKQCKVILLKSLSRVYPLIEPFGVPMPELKIRKMKSQWGNCHWMQGYITLNTALARCPERLRDYVTLHELVHFLHHDHGAGFYGKMDVLMPDWRSRRMELKRCLTALE